METNTAPHGRFVIPEVVATHFHIRKGDVVADFGAGTGYFISTLSKLAGADGRVYALEVQKNLLESLDERVRRENLANVEAVWADLEDEGGTKLRDGALDAGIMVNTLFQLEDKNAALREAVRTLRAGGKFFIVDWSESWGGMGPRPAEVVDEAAATALAESAGFVLERSFDAGGHHYGLAFRKP